MAVLLPQGRQQFFDAAGAPLAGGKVHTYAAGTSTPQATYTDAAGAVANANPVVLNSRGEATIFWDGAYKVVLKDANDVTIWTQDDVATDDLSAPANALRADLADASDAAHGDAMIAVKQPYAGAVARTQHAKNAEIVSVLDFGALGDGTANDTAALQAALDSGSSRVYVPAGTYLFSTLAIPAGRGLMLYGDGPSKTTLRHTGGGSGLYLGADGTQMFSLRDMTIEPSPTTTKLLDFTGPNTAFGFSFYNLELHEGSSGNNTCAMFAIHANATLGDKYYFRVFGMKVHGGGVGISIDGIDPVGRANDHRFFGVQIQNCALDGLLIDNGFNNTFVGSIESCGDGVSTFCYRLEGAADENVFDGRLEFTSTADQVYLNNASGAQNVMRGQMSTTPATPNDLAKGRVETAGIVFDGRQHRMQGLQRWLAANGTDPVLLTALPMDAMGSYGRFGLQANGQFGWSNSSNPSAWDVFMWYSAADDALRVAGKQFRVPAIEVSDGITAPAAKGGVAQIYVDAADGDLKVKFSDGVVKTLAADS